MQQEMKPARTMKPVGLKQPENGYRHAIDPLLLAGTTKLEQNEKVIMDFGTGCGIIPILVARKNPDTEIFGIEIQEELHRFAQQNVKEEGLCGQITLLNKDLKTLTGKDVPKADLIFCNPPYKACGTGRLCPNSQRAVARHEITITLDSLVENVSRRLKKQGRFAVIYPAQRTADLLCSLRHHNMEPRQMRMVHPYKGRDAKLVMVWAVKGSGRGMECLKPLYIHSSPGSYTSEVEEMLA